MRNGVFPAVSVNKDVTGISDSGPPKANSWALRALRKEKNSLVRSGSHYAPATPCGEH